MPGDEGSNPVRQTGTRIFCSFLRSMTPASYFHLSINGSKAHIVSILLDTKSSMHNCIINRLYQVTNLDFLKFNGGVPRKRTRDLGNSLSMDVLKKQKKSLTIQHEHIKLPNSQKSVLARGLSFLPSLDVL